MTTKNTKVTTPKSEEVTEEVTTATRRTYVCQAQVSSEYSRQALATDYDANVFNFNWTMRADGKYDKKGNGKLTLDQRKALQVERDLLMGALVEVTNSLKTRDGAIVEPKGPKDLKAEFDNIWNHLKSKSKYRKTDSADDSGSDTSEAEKFAKLIKAAYNKSTDPEAVADRSVVKDLEAIAKKIGLNLE